MDDELLLVVDENDNPTAPLAYKEVVARKLWRRASGGVIIDGESQKVLCQKRSELVTRPGMWTALFGGKSAPGEAPIETARRELYEELGLRVASPKFTFYKKFKVDKRKQFEYLYTVYWSGDSTNIHFDPKEVSEVVWLDISRVIKLLSHDPGWFSYGYDLDMLKALKDRSHDEEK